MRTKSILLVLMLVLGLFFIPACADQPDEPAAPVTTPEPATPEENEAVYSGTAGRITVYMSGPGSLARQLEEAFEADRGDVLEVLNASGGSLAKRIWAEKEAGEIHADVVLSSEPIFFLSLKREGLLERYVSPETAAFQPQYLFGDGYFTAVNARYGVIVYNIAKVTEDELPTSFADLKASHWNNRLAFADATQSSTALALNAGLYQLFENTWVLQEALQANNIMLLKSNSAVATKVKAGEVDAGIMPHDGILRDIRKDKKDGIDSPLAIAWPEEGAISLQRPIGIIANTARPAENSTLAKEFVDFILSVEAQEIARKFGFISVRNDVKLPSGTPTEVTSITVDWEHVSEQEQELRTSFEEIMGGN